METRGKQDHQPEPWAQNGRYVLDASGWTLASVRFPADARRIVAAVNAVQGIPTDALESWVINVMGEPAGRPGDFAAAPGTSVTVENERRVGERRRGDRRAFRPEIRVLGAEAGFREE